MIRSKKKICMGAIFIFIFTFILKADFSFAMQENTKSIQAAISDQIIVKIDGIEHVMQLYYNGMYEVGEKNISSGKHSYEIYCNNKKIGENTIEVSSNSDIYIRYRPFEQKKIIDSVTNQELFKTSAAWVGNIAESGLGSYLNPIFTNDWAPEEEKGFLDYIGGGIYKKTFSFIEPLPKDISLQYKIAFGGDWNHGEIGQFGGNIPVTIPKGTKEFILWADSANMVCFDSINGLSFHAKQNTEEDYIQPAGKTTVSLVGSSNNWKGNINRMEQITENLYACTIPLTGSAIEYEYKCKFDERWYENGKNQSILLSQDAIVTFLYDVKTDQLYDSVNHFDIVSTALNFTAPVDIKLLDKEAYLEDDLGAVYSKERTIFKVWAPTALEVKLNLYENGDTKLLDSPLSTDSMEKEENGIWTIIKQGDLKGKFYTYSVKIGDKINEVVDIYAKAVGINGNRGMIVDLKDTNPTNWEKDQHVMQKKITNGIIWEVHVKDFSSNKNSGISKENRGKYLAFTERGTTLNGKGKIKTGVDYLVDLGINYVHLLPVFDGENEETKEDFNWGYNPKNYNVPEGSYSSNPSDGVTRIREFKQMVQSLHQADIGVVMDVVYNHTSGLDSWLNLTVPNYYYRQNEDGTFSNGSACGNETASERTMFRKYMIDSILYWTKEYHIDGFRFDLMGIHDTETMNAIREALDKEGLEDVILYGEPWSAGTIALSKEKLPANKENLKSLKGIAAFNDTFRDSMKGFVFEEKSVGFIQGGNQETLKSDEPRQYRDEDILASIQANCNLKTTKKATYEKDAWAKNPSQVINYVSAHDNLSLWDKLVISTDSGNSKEREEKDYINRKEELVKMNRLAAAFVLTSQGIPFFQAGEEFARTKLGDENSYQSDISINQLDWSRLNTFSDLNDYYKGLIQIRKKYAPLRAANKETIKNMKFSEDKKANLIAYTIENPSKKSGEWGTTAFLFNSTKKEQTIKLQTKTGKVPKKWAVIADANRAGISQIDSRVGKTITIAPQSALILVDYDSLN